MRKEKSRSSLIKSSRLASDIPAAISPTVSEIILSSGNSAEAERKIRLLERVAKIESEQTKELQQRHHENIKLYAQLAAGTILLGAGIGSLFIPSIQTFSLILISAGTCALIPGINKVFSSLTRLAIAFTNYTEQSATDNEEKR